MEKEQSAIEALQQESLEKQNEIADLMKGTNSQIEAYTSEISNEENSAQDLLAKVNAQEAEIDKLIKQQKDEEAAAELAKQKAAAQAKAAEEAKKQAAEDERAAQAKAAEAQQSASQEQCFKLHSADYRIFCFYEYKYNGNRNTKSGMKP